MDLSLGRAGKLLTIYLLRFMVNEALLLITSRGGIQYVNEESLPAR
jgi:hypothetical protein